MVARRKWPAIAVMSLSWGCGDPPDAPAIDAARHDASIVVVDASAGPDATPLPDAEDELRDTLGDADYLVATPPLTDVRDVVTGGAPPFSCTFYTGPGPGTVPFGVTQDGTDTSGCVLLGGVSAIDGDSPGAFGFTMIVEDSLGATIEIPIVFEGPTCDTASATLTPPPAPVPVNAPGTATSWQLLVTDLDGVDAPSGCDACLNVSVLTRVPLTIAPILECAGTGDFCSDCDACITFVGACPGAGVATADRPIDLRAHSPMRTDSGPAWVTLELGATYSGDSLDPCSPEEWRCHAEILEL